ncbi:MAG: hypothetical protein ACRELB_21440 [Polyangiaceae bacterium]
MQPLPNTFSPTTPPSPPARTGRLLRGVALGGTLGTFAGCLVAAIARPLLREGWYTTELAAAVGWILGVAIAAVDRAVERTTAPKHGGPSASWGARLGTTGGMAFLGGAVVAVIGSVLGIKADAREFLGVTGGAYGEAAGALIFFVVFVVVAIAVSVVAGVAAGLLMLLIGAACLAFDRAVQGSRSPALTTCIFGGAALGALLVLEWAATSLGSPTAPAFTVVPALVLVAAVGNPSATDSSRRVLLAVPVAGVLLAAATVGYAALAERTRLVLATWPECTQHVQFPGIVCSTIMGWPAHPVLVLQPDGTRPDEDILRDAQALRPARCVAASHDFSPTPGAAPPVKVADPVDVRIEATVHRASSTTMDDATLQEAARTKLRARLDDERSAWRLYCTPQLVDQSPVYPECGRGTCRVDVDRATCNGSPCPDPAVEGLYIRRFDVDVKVESPPADAGAEAAASAGAHTDAGAKKGSRSR